MKTIHKFPLTLDDQQAVVSTMGWRPLSAQLQRGRLMLWAEVDTSAHEFPHSVFVVGTGQPTERVLGDFIGTVQIDGGGLIFHVYAERTPSRVLQRYGAREVR